MLREGRGGGLEGGNDRTNYDGTIIDRNKTVCIIGCTCRGGEPSVAGGGGVLFGARTLPASDTLHRGP